LPQITAEALSLNTGPYTQICDGLQAAREGEIHRGIKPATIFLTSKGVCKIPDFRDRQADGGSAGL
jgi:hypothetical protein